MNKQTNTQTKKDKNKEIKGNKYGKKQHRNMETNNKEEKNLQTKKETNKERKKQ